MMTKTWSVRRNKVGDATNWLERTNRACSMFRVQRSSDGTFVMRQEVNTTGFEDESFVSGGDL